MIVRLLALVGAATVAAAVASTLAQVRRNARGTHIPTPDPMAEIQVDVWRNVVQADWPDLDPTSPGFSREDIARWLGVEPREIHRETELMAIDWFKAFMETDSGKLVYAVIGVAILDFVLGTLAAFRDKTFALDSVAAFLRKHFAGRVAPIVALLVFGYAAGQDAITVIGIAAAGLYLAETIGSIKDSWAPGRPAQPVPVD